MMRIRATVPIPMYMPLLRCSTPLLLFDSTIPSLDSQIGTATPPPLQGLLARRAPSCHAEKPPRRHPRRQRPTYLHARGRSHARPRRHLLRLPSSRGFARLVRADVSCSRRPRSKSWGAPRGPYGIPVGLVRWHVPSLSPWSKEARPVLSSRDWISRRPRTTNFRGSAPRRLAPPRLYGSGGGNQKEGPSFVQGRSRA